MLEILEKIIPGDLQMTEELKNKLASKAHPYKVVSKNSQRMVIDFYAESALVTSLGPKETELLVRSV